jgi:hypothetical protein
VYRFKIKNLYEETVHITGVRTSCGCTSASIERPTLKTFETGEIVAEFDTRKFNGQHSATLTVSIDQPFPAEVQLQVYGNIRTDVVFHPGEAQFGSVDQGQPAEQRIALNYAGRDDWAIEDIRSANKHLEVELNENARGGGRVSYDLLVRLADDAPPGYFNNQLIVVTNDSKSRLIPLDVSGRVVPEITVTPTTLVLGEVESGKDVSEKLVVRGKRPFKITEVECENENFSFEVADESKSLHLVTLNFQAPAEPGRVRETIRIHTDRGDLVVEMSAAATVVASKSTAFASPDR